ncbi:hypothetical protein R1flu_016757 [Riccia fluitans]|uniref:Uncharacterized protein n=1 Tax=Riccia fluitans TaxID=41844 RepID=A0ABD1YMS1_9MARC
MYSAAFYTGDQKKLGLNKANANTVGAHHSSCKGDKPLLTQPKGIDNGSKYPLLLEWPGRTQRVPDPCAIVPCWNCTAQGGK